MRETEREKRKEKGQRKTERNKLVHREMRDREIVEEEMNTKGEKGKWLDREGPKERKGLGGKERRKEWDGWRKGGGNRVVDRGKDKNREEGTGIE